ncbi:tetratricopeptide repeat protein [uncultured Croceitalea sp.]|uniref:tetratricopeptide repeat protein n=1 Tax=uncultured Croceitalea sp. TaxID=1798908 RepID=UPI0033063740
MKVISSHEFKHILKDIHKNSESRKFCFILGAGASYNSGIPTGSELAKQWFSEIEQRMLKSELKKWMNENKIDSKNLGAAYGNIYRKRFENDKTSGYESLVQVMKKAKPTFGHIVLAQVLSTIPGHCVLTTNFDNLVESAVYQFTNKTPLVCGHESLSGYARPSNIHPLIIKVHRDLLLNPKSTPEEIHQLASGWYEPLDTIFGTHIPIVIGYGGNDGSLMSYFENMKKPSNFFWCGRNENSTSPYVKGLITKLDGRFVKIKGFDELMYELLPVFDEIKPLEEELNDITKNRVSIATKKLEELSAFEDDEIASSNEELIEKELSALEYDNLARKEMNLEKRKEIYLEALKHYPKTAWLWNVFTHFLHFIKKDYQNLEEYYLKALSVDPNYVFNNGNYAIYLEEIKKDYPEAEKYYLKSISLDSEDPINTGNYANYLKEIKKDYDAAEKYYIKAIALDNNNVINTGNFASYLRFIKKDYQEAEKYYLKALSIEPENANNNGNYASYLQEIKKDYAKAEKYYLKALSIEPENANNNGDYATYQHFIKKDYQEAEKYYLKALKIEPENANNNGNYANYLQQIKKDYAKAEKYYLKALKIEPEQPNNNGNYANYLHIVKKDYQEAEKYYLKALKIQPEHANNNGNYSQLLLIQERKKVASKFLNKAFQLNGDEKSDLLIELWFYRFAHYPEYLSEAEQKIEKLLGEGIRSIGWDFGENIKVAIKENHPNQKKLKEFAKRITTAK